MIGDRKSLWCLLTNLDTEDECMFGNMDFRWKMRTISVRLRLKNMGQIKQKVNGKDKTVGMKVRCQVIKNRMVAH